MIHPFLGALVILWAVSAAGCGGDSSPVPVAAGPTQKLQEAAAAMKTVNAFRFTAEVVSGSQQVHVTGEFSAPDRLHETVLVGASTLELVKIGTRTFRRDTPTAPWQAVAPVNTTAAATDPRLAFDALAAPSAVQVEGSTYHFSLSSAAAASLVNGSKSVTGAAVVDGGRITDLSYRSNNPSVSVHLIYSAFNSTPVVTPPPGM